MREHYIGLDVHCTASEMAVVTGSGRLTRRDRCATTIAELTRMIESVPRRRWLCFEEGPLADWLYRSLRGTVAGITVCEPRRNRLIAKDSDKDDPIDAGKLACLFRGGYLKAVHHPDSLDRALFKQHVGLYEDQVRERVRAANQIIAYLRRHGVVVEESDFADRGQREELLERLPESETLRGDHQMLWEWYDLLVAHEATARRNLVKEARGKGMILRFRELPGIDWIRASIFYAYVDTPWRFRRKTSLWKYMGIGLERWQSGKGPKRVRLAKSCNRKLKAMILGAAQSAIGQGNSRFYGQYVSWREGGLSPQDARRNVARAMAATLWGMWKTNTAYRPEWVGT